MTAHTATTAADRARSGARKPLAETSDEGLLRTFATLTHRMHGWPASHSAVAPDRAKRDLVEAEILRRMGGRA